MKKNNSKKRFYVELHFNPKEYSLNGGISINDPIFQIYKVSKNKDKNVLG